MTTPMPDFMDLAVRKYEPGSIWRGKKVNRTRQVIKVDRDGIHYRQSSAGAERLCWFTTWNDWVGERVS